MKYSKRALAYMFTATVLLSGCGGSSTTIIVTDGNSDNGSSTPTTVNNQNDTTQTNTNQSTPTAVKVIDGYIFGSTVKDESGNVAKYDKDSNTYIFNNKEGFVTAKGGIVDIDGKLDTQDDRRWFKTDTNGDGLGDSDGSNFVLEAPSSYSVITPLTTLVAFYMKDQNLSLSDAEQAVANLFGIYPEDINKDPYSTDNKLKDRTKTAITIMELAKRWQYTSTISKKAVVLPGMDQTTTSDQNSTTSSSECVTLPGGDPCTTSNGTTSNQPSQDTNTTNNTQTAEQSPALPGATGGTTPENNTSNQATQDINATENAQTQPPANCLPGQVCTDTGTNANNQAPINVPAPENIIKFNDGEDVEQIKSNIETKINEVMLELDNSNKSIVEVLKDYEKRELGAETISNDMIFTN